MTKGKTAEYSDALYWQRSNSKRTKLIIGDLQCPATRIL